MRGKKKKVETDWFYVSSDDNQEQSSDEQVLSLCKFIFYSLLLFYCPLRLTAFWDEFTLGRLAPHLN